MTFTNIQTFHTSCTVTDNIARVSKIDKFDENDTNSLVVLEDSDFINGTIEIDVKADLLRDAPSHARGFIGIAYHCTDTTDHFECFYIRPTNGKDCIDPIRKQHACQYFAYPGYTFSYFREFGITQYESPIDSIALNEWAHIKAVIQNEKASFYVNDVRVLQVTSLLKENKGNKIALFTDIGTAGYFKNLQICK